MTCSFKTSEQWVSGDAFYMMMMAQHDFLKGMALPYSVLINKLHQAAMMESKILIGVGIYKIGKRVLFTSGRILISSWP